jgi:hypothetical protein
MISVTTPHLNTEDLASEQSGVIKINRLCVLETYSDDFLKIW